MSDEGGARSLDEDQRHQSLAEIASDVVVARAELLAARAALAPTRGQP